MDIEFKASKVEVSTHTVYEMTVSVETDDQESILDQIGFKTAVEHFDKDDILDEIGVDYVKEYFGLKDEDEK